MSGRQPSRRAYDSLDLARPSRPLRAYMRCFYRREGSRRRASEWRKAVERTLADVGCESGEAEHGRRAGGPHAQAPALALTSAPLTHAQVSPIPATSPRARLVKVSWSGTPPSYVVRPPSIGRRERRCCAPGRRPRRRRVSRPMQVVGRRAAGLVWRRPSDEEGLEEDAGEGWGVGGARGSSGDEVAERGRGGRGGALRARLRP